MDIDTAELRRAWRRTRPYLLSHHEPDEWDRCYAPTVSGRQFHVCARCAGIYPGIAIGVIAGLLGRTDADLGIITLTPLPALVDWLATTDTDRRGHNAVRTITGGLLGYGYGRGLARLVHSRDMRVIAIGASYATLAATLLSGTVIGSP